jgi:hypothetical protein
LSVSPSAVAAAAGAARARKAARRAVRSRTARRVRMPPRAAASNARSPVRDLLTAPTERPSVCRMSSPVKVSPVRASSDDPIDPIYTGCKGASGEPATAGPYQTGEDRSPRSACGSVSTSAGSVVRHAGTHCCCLPLWRRLSLVASEPGPCEAGRLPRQALNIKLMLSHYAGAFVCCAWRRDCRLQGARGRRSRV